MTGGRNAAVLLAAALLALGGCSGALSGLRPDQEMYKFESSASDVEFGMSKTRVQYVMGVPKRRLYEGSQEAWQWCQTSTNPERADAFLTVYFYGARVVGIHTYGNRAEGECDNFFRRVEWIADPEKALAAKARRKD
jgi:outer membrane protein assembly factor BamE (lipoprotein component of BamABCDE complex)